MEYGHEQRTPNITFYCVFSVQRKCTLWSKHKSLQRIDHSSLNFQNIYEMSSWENAIF